jgi:DNA-binding XRE family transcriptional regulator
VAPTQASTIGEHLKACRLTLHLFQTDAAKQIGVEKTTIQNWERGIKLPPDFDAAAAVSEELQKKHGIQG